MDALQAPSGSAQWIRLGRPAFRRWLCTATVSSWHGRMTEFVLLTFRCPRNDPALALDSDSCAKPTVARSPSIAVRLIHLGTLERCVPRTYVLRDWNWNENPCEWRGVRRHQVRNRFGKEAMAASVSGGIEDFP